MNPNDGGLIEASRRAEEDEDRIQRESNAEKVRFIAGLSAGVVAYISFTMLGVKGAEFWAGGVAFATLVAGFTAFAPRRD